MKGGGALSQQGGGYGGGGQTQALTRGGRGGLQTSQTTTCLTSFISTPQMTLTSQICGQLLGWCNGIWVPKSGANLAGVTV